MAGWRHLLEPEESIGTLWHRATQRIAQQPNFPEAAVRLDTERARLAVFFRGLGGAGSVELRPAATVHSGHRLSFLRRVGNERERVIGATFDGVILALPEAVDTFASRELNADLYLWLTALTTVTEPDGIIPADPLQADLYHLRRTRSSIAAAFSVGPGLLPIYRRLADATAALRPRLQLPPAEQEIEDAIRTLLTLAAGEPLTSSTPMLSAIAEPGRPLDQFRAPFDYKPMRPVPLWPAVLAPPPARKRPGARDDEAGTGASESGEKRLKAQRRKADQADRKDSLILHRFEHILSWAEFLNINRAVDDDDEDNARKIADDADQISVVKNRKKAVTRLKFDLDLAPDDADTEKLSGTHLYPEWDYRRGTYHADHARVLASVADAAPEGLKLDGPTRRRIDAVRRRFEALRPGRSTVPRQLDGDELDLEAAVRAAIDIRACGEGSDHIWRRRRDTERDLAVSVLIDTSRSTEGACGNRTVIDIAREALIALVEGVAACGDSIAVHSFSSLRRDRVFVRTVKDYDERIDDQVRARIAGLKPGFYTRIGAALRHSSKGLAARPNRKKLLLVITDGRPNDLDHYEGRYGTEDTRRAVLEARRLGMAVFGVTVDAKARAYFPYIFGANGFAIVSRPDRLATALPLVWQHLVEE